MDLKLDYTIESAEERNELVKRIIEKTPPEQLTPKYLEYLTDYIIFAMDKAEKREKIILTDNRMVTVNKRETSFEGLTGKLENGEDGIYQMIANDKNIIFSPNVTITKKDIEEIPFLKSLREDIEKLEEKAKTLSGKEAYQLKKQIIELRQDQYVIKNTYRRPIYCLKTIKSLGKLELNEKIYLDEQGEIKVDGFLSLLNPDHVSLLLCNYSKIKEDTYSNFQSDARWMIMDLENLIDKTLKENYPLYYDLIIYKIDGKTNQEIQELLNEKHGIKHSLEYISSLWRNKVPKLIAEQAQEDWLIWHFTHETKGVWKKCSRCGQIKLAHNRFFSKNKTAKSGFYSICKCCRNKKNK